MTDQRSADDAIALPTPPDPTATATAETASSKVVAAVSTRSASTAPPERLAAVFFFVIFLLAMGALAYLFSSFFADLVMAMMFAGLCFPAYRWLLPRVGGRAWIASLLMTTLVFVSAALPTGFIVASLSTEAAAVYSTSKDSVTLQKWPELFEGDGPVATTIRKAAGYGGVELTPERMRSWFAEGAGKLVSFIYREVNALVASVVSSIYHLVIILVLVFYLLIDGSRLKRFVFRLSPLPDEHEELLARTFQEVARAIVFGNGIASVVQGVLGGIALAVVGIPSPVLWGTIMSILAFLPFVGISLVTIPATAYLIIEGRIATAVVFILFCTTQSFFVENIVKTKLIGDQMKMHNLLIFLAVLGGLASFGILGLLYGPLLVALFFTILELYERHYKRFIDSSELRPMAQD